ncbi:MAG: aminoglycoside phosphotransferase family protein [Candidatus Thorarchaeota archaeon]
MNGINLEIKRLIGRGRTADVFEIDETKVLKLYHKNYPLRIVQYEYNVNKFLQDQLQFIPKVFDLVEYEERPGIVFERIEGITLLEFLMNNPLRLFKVTKNFAKLHTEVHKCDFIGFMTQIEFLRNDIMRNKLLDEETKKKIVEKLEKLPTRTVLCHRDFHPDNIFKTSKGLIVIDWPTAVEGAPAGDVARTYFILGHGQPTGKLSLLDKIKVKLFQAITSRQYLKNYLKSSKISRKEIKEWELVTIAGRLSEGIPQEQDYILKRIKKLLKKESNNGK